MTHPERPRTARCISISILDEAPPCSRRLVEHGLWNLAAGLRGDFRVLRGGERIELASSEILLLRRCESEARSLEVTAVGSAAPGERAALLWATFYDAPSDGGERARAPGAMHLPAHEVAANSAIRSVLALLEAELVSPSAESHHLARGLGDALFEYVARSAAQRANNGAGAQRPRLLDRQIRRALELFEAKPGSRWTLEALAKAAGLSRAQFARRFAAALGMPPRRYVASRRLQLAAELLTDGDDSLAAIAARVGYESEFAFSRAFKRFSGEAPGLFRRRMRLRPGVTLALAA